MNLTEQEAAFLKERIKWWLDFYVKQGAPGYLMMKWAQEHALEEFDKQKAKAEARP